VTDLRDRDDLQVTPEFADHLARLLKAGLDDAEAHRLAVVETLAEAKSRAGADYA
jgi:hypothetical protein